MTSPGSTIFAALARWLDPNLLQSVVAPTIADLQYEVQTAGSPWRRRLMRARGYVAVARLVLWHGLIWRSPMRTLLAIVVLGLAGAACLVEMFSVTTSGPVQIMPLFLMTIAAPIVLRFVVGVNTRRGMFLTCMGVGTVMCVVFHGWFALVLNPGHAAWYAYVPGLVFLLACVTAASGIIAIVTASPDTEGTWNVRGKLANVVASAATFAICYSLIGVVNRPSSNMFGVLEIVSWGVFLAFVFVAVLVVVYLPILMASRRLLQQHSESAAGHPWCAPLPCTDAGVPPARGALGSRRPTVAQPSRRARITCAAVRCRRRDARMVAVGVAAGREAGRLAASLRNCLRSGLEPASPRRISNAYGPFVRTLRARFGRHISEVSRKSLRRSFLKTDYRLLMK